MLAAMALTRASVAPSGSDVAALPTEMSSAAHGPLGP